MERDRNENKMKEPMLPTFEIEQGGEMERDRNRNENKMKEPMLPTFEIEKGEELIASSTKMSQQLGIPDSSQGSRREKSIFPTQLSLPVYPPQKLNQSSHLEPQEDSENHSISSDNSVKSQKLHTSVNDAESDGATHMSLPTKALDRGDDVCDKSAMDSMSVNLSPDDVASKMGQIHFWKARSTIVNQQRLFAAQVFELHRLIEVQKLMAESPDILFEEGAYLGNPLIASATKKLQLNHNVEPISNIDKPKVAYEKTDIRILNLEKAVEKTPISSSQIDNLLSNYREGPRLIGPLYGPRLPNFMMGNYLNHRLTCPHYPASTPAISLPPPLIPSMPPSSGFSLEKMEALHKNYQNIYNMLNQNSAVAREVLKFSPSSNGVHVSMANTSSHTTQTTSSTPAIFPPSGRPVIPMMPLSSVSMYKMDYHHKCYQTICNMLNPTSEFAREVMKFSPSKNEVGMASTSSHAAQTTSCTLSHRGIEQHHVLSISPTSAAINVGTSNQPIQDFKVLSPNARSATQQDESDTSFNSSDDDFDSEDLSSSSDTSPSSAANDAECDKETHIISPPMVPSLEFLNKMNELNKCYESTCYMLFAAEVMKLTQSKNIEGHASMASTSSQAPQTTSSTPIRRGFESPVVAIFPPSPAINVGTPNQPTQGFKVLPDNARSATQSLPQTFHPSQNTLKRKQRD